MDEVALEERVHQDSKSNRIVKPNCGLIMPTAHRRPGDMCGLCGLNGKHSRFLRRGRKQRMSIIMSSCTYAPLRVLVAARQEKSTFKVAAEKGCSTTTPPTSFSMLYLMCSRDETTLCGNTAWSAMFAKLSREFSVPHQKEEAVLIIFKRDLGSCVNVCKRTAPPVRRLIIVELHVLGM